MTRIVASAWLLVLACSGCSGESAECRANRALIEELEAASTPAAAWDDIADLQGDIAERERALAERRSLDC